MSYPVYQPAEDSYFLAEVIKEFLGSKTKKEKINVYSYDREMLPKEDLSEIISESIGSSANSKNIWY